MKNAFRKVPEFSIRKETRRAGFVPSEYGRDAEVEQWTVWCRNHESGEERRATYADMDAAGLKKKKRRK